MHTPTLAVFLGLSILGTVALTGGQSSQQSSTQSPDNPTPALTLHAASRIVLADVVVTDRHGNPVRKLTARDFQVFDNGRPQRISSFEENDGTKLKAYTAPTTRSTSASNDFRSLPAVVNVILLDTTNLDLPDQMYLRIQLTKFLKGLPSGQPMAVFERHGDSTVLLQGFTSDRALLQAAIDRALPRIVLGGREYRTDIDTLRQMSAYLAQVPGHKNVLWFSGGSTAFLLTGLSALSAASPMGPAPSSAAAAASAAASAPSTPIANPSAGDDPDELRKVYDDLEAARVAIYPIDARGLTTEGDVALEPQHSQMDNVAQATGGEAIYNNNGLGEATARLVSADSNSYTLTYSPQDFHYDGKWHNIRIVLRDSSYHLSYRRGYFADQPASLEPKKGAQKILLAGDAQPATLPDVRSSPLLFEASVHAASDTTVDGAGYIKLEPATATAKGTNPFRIDYALSTAGLSSAEMEGAERATVVFAAIALNGNGVKVGEVLNQVRFRLDPNGPPHRLQVEQQIDLPKGGDFLALAVWDPVSGHVGTLQIPVTVGSRSK